MTYIQAAAGHLHTVLLKSDGTAVAFGCNQLGQCEIPPPPAGLKYTPSTPSLRRILQAAWDFLDEGVHIRLLELSGKECCRFTVPTGQQLASIQSHCTLALGTSSVAVVLPHGQLLHQEALRNPAGTLEDLHNSSKRRKSMETKKEPLPSQLMRLASLLPDVFKQILSYVPLRGNGIGSVRKSK